MINSNEDIFVIDCWIDNQSKRNNLINLINRLRIYNIPIVLTGHYAVDGDIQRLVDFYLFDRNNPLLLREEFKEYGVNSTRWSDMTNCRIENQREFHHDYAIWETMRNSFKFCHALGKKYIHFLEYDNLPDEIQYRQAILERIREVDAVIYEYDKGSSKISDNPYCATFIFSIRSDIGVKTIEQIKTKEEFFKNKPDRWQLEKNFLNSLRKVTNSILVSSYIPNNNELNMQAAWGREGIPRNGTNLQFYTAVDENDDLYLHIISKEDHFIEVTYGDYAKFHHIKSNNFINILLGKYQLLQTICVYHQGIQIYEETLGQSMGMYREINKMIWKSKSKDEPKQVNINFIDGPFVEILNNEKKLYHVEFIDTKTNNIDFQINLESNHWAKCNKMYHTEWMIRIKGIDNDYYYEHQYNPEGKKILIGFESKSLGDTLAWMPYVEKYRVERRCQVVCSTFHNNLFKTVYPELEFVEPGIKVNNLYGLYRIGLFMNDDNYQKDKHPSDPKREPLMKIASDILGMDYVELKPKLPTFTTEKKKVVSIGIHATAQCKYWNNPTGWQDVVDYLTGNGYEVKLLSKEEDGYMGNKNPKNVTVVPPGGLENIIKILQESELFIGISSGLSWLAWASGTETILISGFTDVSLEPTIGIERIINRDVCNSCWGEYKFDPGNWNWCPIHENTDRMFECSKQIKSELVIKQIDKILGLSKQDVKALQNIYNYRIAQNVDINEHMPTLKRYAEECEKITEFGVRDGFSTIAFLMGKPKKLVSYDIEPMENFTLNRVDVKRIAKSNGTNFDFYEGDSTKIAIEETDFLFIDTYHSYTQLKTELNLHHDKVKKYIGFHDTVTFGTVGNDGKEPGLIQAIDEFIEEHPNWKIYERYENNNGLLIIKKDI